MTEPDARIHAQAAVGFGRAADAYERGRPDYPTAAIAHLLGVLNVTASSRVVELGAGTGKFTTHLAATGAHVVAVEPVANMLARLSERLSGVHVVDGTAEAIPLAGQSVDAVFAAQAFHWFAADRALAEISRVLKPGGGLGLIWNVRDESLPWVRRLTAILDPHEAGAPRYRTLEWMAAFRQSDQLSPLESQTFPHVQQLTPNALVDRVASISFIAAMSEAQRESVLDQIRALLQADPELRGKKQFEMSYQTRAYWAFRR
jgi:SAM-dependent methyltransferase